MGKKNDFEDEEMTVELELEDGTNVNCAIITILTVDSKDYIVLLPLNEEGENEDGEVWFYGYSENPDDPNEEPVLDYIADDEEYEKVAGLEQKIDDMTEIFRGEMMGQIQKGLCSEEGSILFSEMLTDFERIGDHALNISKEMTLINR